MYGHYHAGWAWSGNAPFKYFKQAVHRGGESDMMLVHWPDRVGEAGMGQSRKQYAHIVAGPSWSIIHTHARIRST